MANIFSTNEAKEVLDIAFSFIRWIFNKPVIQGKVTRRDQITPISGVIVWIEGKSRHTDKEGGFVLEGVGTGFKQIDLEFQGEKIKNVKQIYVNSRGSILKLKPISLPSEWDETLEVVGPTLEGYVLDEEKRAVSCVIEFNKKIKKETAKSGKYIVQLPVGNYDVTIIYEGRVYERVDSVCVESKTKSLPTITFSTQKKQNILVSPENQEKQILEQINHLLEAKEDPQEKHTPEELTPHMRSRFFLLQEEKTNQVSLYKKHWEDFVSDFQGFLGGEDLALFSKNQEHLFTAVNNFHAELKSPRVILATTGTTSSGKSSLVNFLCGVELMPVAVQEMSAGVVIITHGERTRLSIEKTKGALWGCGDWFDLSESEIRKHLTDVMNSYNDARNTPQEPECPQIHLCYPTRIGLHRHLFGIPSSFEVQIMDLPGLKFIGDEGNARVIRRCKDALAIVTYNSFETDPIKQEKLLEEVARQVKEMGGSPVRMLFVLNRIDAFRSDRDWAESERIFVEKKKVQIREKISLELPEYAHQAARIEVTKLSTLPALYALLALSDGEKRIESMQQLTKLFSNIIPDDLLEDLPRNIRKCSDADIKKVASAVMESSYANDFQGKLRLHIDSHLPEIFFPPALKRVVDGLLPSLNFADQLLNAFVAVANNRYGEECLRIDFIKKELEISRNGWNDQLFSSLKSLSHNFGGEKLQSVMSSLGKNLASIGLNPECTVPFYDWSHEFGIAIQSVMDSLYEAVVFDPERFKGDYVEFLPIDSRTLMRTACQTLKSCGYFGDFAKKGGIIEEEKSSTNARLEILNSGLNSLAAALARILREVLEKVALREIKRIYEATENIFQTYQNFISRQAYEIAPDIIGLVFTENTFEKVPKNLHFQVPLQAGFSKKTTQKQIETGTQRVKTGTIKVQTTERKWYSLWLYNHTVEKEEDVFGTRPVYTQRAFEEANIPSIESVISGFIEQASASLPSIESDFYVWLREQFLLLTKSIESYQEALMSEYGVRLNQAQSKAEQEKTDRINDLLPLQAKLQYTKHLVLPIQDLKG